MNKVFVPAECPYWIWEMPEVVSKIPELLKEAGVARVTGKGISSHNVYVEVKLHKPAKVVDWTVEAGDGVGINASTNAFVTAMPNSPAQFIDKLPCDGDTVIKLCLNLELQYFNEHQAVTVEDLENALRSMATSMTKTWYYHFKK